MTSVARNHPSETKLEDMFAVSLDKWRARYPRRRRCLSTSLPEPSDPVDLDKERGERAAFRELENLLTLGGFVPVVDLVKYLRQIHATARREQLVRLLFRNHGGLIGVERAWDDLRTEMIDSVELMGLSPLWVRCVDRISNQYLH